MTNIHAYNVQVQVLLQSFPKISLWILKLYESCIDYYQEYDNHAPF